MNPETKQRVVGIIVLVAFVALLVPFLFTSGLKKKSYPEGGVESTSVQIADGNASIPTSLEGVASQTLANDSAQPVATIQPVELLKDSNTSTVVPPGDVPFNATLPASIPADVNAGAEVKVPISDVATSATTVPVAAGKVEVVPDVNRVVKTEEKIESAVSSEVESPVKAKAKVVVKSPVKNTRVKSSVIKSGGVGLWSVQVGSFSDEQRMKKLVSNLQVHGFKTYLQKIDTSRGVMVRVLVGRETTKEKAVKISEQLNKKLKVVGQIVSNKK